MAEIINLSINKYISEKSQEITSLLLEHNRVFIQSNPATGKTTFFKNLGKTIVDKSLNSRLIFVFPLLLIQDQFKESLKKDGYEIDLELNSNSIRKKIIESDRIVTSTFQSLHNISNALTPDDIIIVDESHSLFKSYLNQDTRERSFYTQSIIDLYFTKAKLVLMSGTPPDGIMNLLDLRHIKITNVPPPLKANIFLLPTLASKKTLAVEFAIMAVNKNGANSLNIIYLKDIKKGVIIAEYLNGIKIKSKVLNSSLKKSDLYISISKNLIVPDDIQILITTNVISSGANIMNQNVGDALMIDEYNPAEIKQFSKRFRNRLDINVVVSNSPNKRILSIPSDEIRILIINQKFYLKRLLNYLNSIKKRSFYNYDYSFSYDKSNFGSPDHLIHIILQRYLIQETFYWENYCSFADNPNRNLVEELNKYDDINALLSETIISKPSDIEFTDELSLEINSITIDLIKYPKKYISTIVNYVDAYQRFRILNTLNDYTQEKTDYEVSKKIKHPLFQKEILDPLLNNVEYFDNDPSKCLYFLMTYSSRELTKYKISYATAFFLNNHIIFEPNIQSLGDYKIILSSETLKSSIDQEDKNCFKLIQIIVQYYYSNKSIILSELVESLSENKQIKRILNFPKRYQRLPMREMKLGKDGYVLSGFFINAFLSGVFHLNRKQSKTLNSKNEKVKGYFFIDHFPEKDKEINHKEYLRLHNVATQKSQPIKSHTVANRRTEKKLFYFRNVEITKIPSSPELLQLAYLDKEFFNLLKD